MKGRERWATTPPSPRWPTRLAEQVIAGGVNSGARGPDAGWLPSPPVVARGKGAEIWDVDGNKYIDHLLALGPMIHGHAHPEMTEAVTRAIQRPQHDVRAALRARGASRGEAIVDAVPSVDLVRFSNSGTEAVLHATRIARAATGRTIVVRFEGQYHGWADQLEWSHHPDLDKAGPVSRPNAMPGSLGIPEAFGSALAVHAVERHRDDRGVHGRARRRGRRDPDRADHGQHGRDPAQARLPRAAARAGHRARLGADLRRGDHGVPGGARRRAGASTA